MGSLPYSSDLDRKELPSVKKKKKEWVNVKENRPHISGVKSKLSSLMKPIPEFSSAIARSGWEGKVYVGT